MSAVYFCTIFCNHKKCKARFTSDSPRAEHTRAAAKEQGWTHERRPRLKGGPAFSLDLCPEHPGAPDDQVWIGTP